MKKNGTVKMLVLSAVSVVLCLVMLLGATFAWFTNRVTSAGNIIRIADFDVRLEWKEAKAGSTYATLSTTAIFGADAGADDAALLPGDYTKIVYIKVTNESDNAVNATVTFTLTPNTTSPLKYHYVVLNEEPTADVTKAQLTEGNQIFTSFSPLLNTQIDAHGVKIVAVAFELPSSDDNQNSLIDTSTTFDIYVSGDQQQNS